MKMYKLAVIVFLGLTGCLDSPTSNQNFADTGDPSLLITCEEELVLDGGALLKVQVVPGSAPVTVADQITISWGLTEDNGVLYFAEDGTGSCTGSIKKLNTADAPGTTPELLISGLSNPRALLVHNGFLYFSESSYNGSINRVDLGSGIRTTLVQGLNSPFAVAAYNDGADTWIYFSEKGTEENGYSDGTVKSFYETTGAVTEIDTLAENLRIPVGLAVDPSYVYVVETYGGRVFRMNREAPNSPRAQENLMTGLSTPYPPWLEGPNDGTNTLYFADFNAGEVAGGKIFKLEGVDSSGSVTALTPADCGIMALLSCTLLADSLGWPMVVVVDNNEAYWSEVWSASIQSISTDGLSSAPSELANGVMDGFKAPLMVVTDGQFVYFTDIGDNPCCI